MITARTKESVQTPRNNDPLAHVYLLLDSYDGRLAEHRIYTEFVTDMGERLVDQPFKSTYGYTYNENEIVYDTGLQYIASLEQSYEAAIHDVTAGRFAPYHKERQYAFKEQGKEILNWLNTIDSSQHLLLVSLCPPHEELAYTEAKKQSFKPDRMMASVQLHSKNNDGSASTIAFSLDGLTINRLQMLLTELGLDTTTATTTLEQVPMPIHIHAEDTADVIATTIIDTYDKQLHILTNDKHMQGVSLDKKTVEANGFVAAHPQAFTLYKTIIEQVAVSLKTNTVQHELAETIANSLTRQYQVQSTIPTFLKLKTGDVFTPHIAGEVIDYLRKRAIPEYLTSKLTATWQVSESTHGDIGSAGASATQSGRVYDGACPSSADSSAQQAVLDQASRLGLNTIVTQEAPKPLFIVGNYAVIPIGSCPASCATECGIGIKDIRSGNWYCANSKRCSGYNAEVYNFVFNPTDYTETTTSQDTSETELKVTKQNLKQDVGIELRQMQYTIWQLRSLMFDESLTDAERQEIITNLIAADLRKQHLLRVAIGSEAYIQNETSLTA